MGSAGFLLIFAVVNAANAKLYKETMSHRWISIIGTIFCIVALMVLIWQRAISYPSNLIILAIMIGFSFIIEFVYKKKTGRIIQPVYKTKNINN
jgi:hypothetical protein